MNSNDSLIEQLTDIRNGIFYWMTRNIHTPKGAVQVLGQVKESLTEIIADMWDASARKDEGASRVEASVSAAPVATSSTNTSEIPGNSALISGLDTMALTFAQWIERNGGEDETHVITPPVWPTIGVLKAWVCTLVRAQRLLSERKPVSVSLEEFGLAVHMKLHEDEVDSKDLVRVVCDLLKAKGVELKYVG